MLNKFIVAMACMLLLTACSGTKVIEKSTYIESQSMPALKIPADMELAQMKSAYPVPPIKASIQGKTPEELEKLKIPPNLLKK